MPTIYDVARAAGVSPATVSFVLNDGPRPVSKQTRARVLEAMESLQFRPSAAARNLARGRLNQVGLCFAVTGVGLFFNPYAAALSEGALDAADDLEYDLVLVTQRQRPLAETLHRGRMDGGLLVIPPDTLDLSQTGRDFPLVTVGGPPPGANGSYDNVDVDSAKGMRLAVAHLLSLGHHRLGHVTGTLEQFDSRLRRDSFLDALAGSGLSDPTVIIGSYVGADRSRVAAAVREALQRPDPPTALVCANDFVARCAQDAAESLNWTIPGDLSLTGFDDSPMSRTPEPALTTLHQPVREVGHAAMKRLIQRIEESGVVPQNLLIEPELIVRESTGPPRPDGPNGFRPGS